MIPCTTGAQREGGRRGQGAPARRRIWWPCHPEMDIFLRNLVGINAPGGDPVSEAFGNERELNIQKMKGRNKTGPVFKSEDKKSSLRRCHMIRISYLALL